MKVFLRCADDDCGWIIRKFAERLRDELSGMENVEVSVGLAPDGPVDVCHHLGYWMFEEKLGRIDTLMVTHIDKLETRHMLTRALASADLGVCMSAQTMQKLRRELSVPAHRFCYVHPAQDGNWRPRPLRIGITSRVYDDGRKNEDLLLELIGRVDPRGFHFNIMGEGWDEVVATLRTEGFQVEYTAGFDRGRYEQLINGLDYYLYMGHDEGSMGFLDALAAGVKTIVTPQGFHLDVPEGITHAINDRADFRRVFELLERETWGRSQSVVEWSWRRHAIKHLELWTHLLRERNHPGVVAIPISKGMDGVRSLVEESEMAAAGSGRDWAILGKVAVDGMGALRNGWVETRRRLRPIARSLLGNRVMTGIWLLRRSVAKRFKRSSMR